MKIVADRAIPFIQYFFSACGELQLVNGRDINCDIVKDADVLLVRTVTKINEQLLKDSRVRFVASATSGIDHVDLDYLKDRGIGFAHAAGCNARSVAEYVLSSLFVLAEQYGLSLQDKRVGIVGYGHVGSQLNAFLQVCGIPTLIHDPFLEQDMKEIRFHKLDEVLQADIVSLHVPLTTEGPYPTCQLLNAVSMQHLREDVILFNTSRGGVIDEAALLEFKSRNNEAHLVLDVWENEPDIKLPLLRQANINTPHIAGYSTDGKLRGTQMVYQQLCRHFDEKLPEQSSPALPDAEVAEITLAEQDSELEALQLAVLTAYDVRSDSASLRRILEISEGERAAFFNELRNHYPLRREFSAITVNLSDVSGSVEQSLSALGFNVNRV